MPAAPTMDAEYISKIGFAMGCISFADEDLDASLSEISSVLADHGLVVSAQDPERLHVAMAQSLALAAALRNIYDVSSLETLMLTVGFLGDPDEPDMLNIKAIALDLALVEAVAIESAGTHPSSAADAERLMQVRRAAGEVLAGRGIAIEYFRETAQSKAA